MNTFILLLGVLSFQSLRNLNLIVLDSRHNVRIKGAWDEQLAVEENNTVLFDIHKDTRMRFFVTKRRFALEMEKLCEIMT